MARMLRFLALAAVMLAAGAAGAEPAKAPASPSTQVPGVTVTGKRPVLKPCSPRDQACIATVIAELKAHYPDQLAVWCATQNTVVMKKNLNPEMFTSDNLPALSGQFDVPAATQQACASGAKRVGK
jgi:hypothetical protein